MTRDLGTEDIFSLPPGTREVAGGLYAGRPELRRLRLPEGLERLGDEAFAGCEQLEELTLPATLRDTGVAVFSDCPALRRVTLPEGLARIGAGAFLHCTALRALTLPRSLRGIGEMAFWGAGLERIDIPSGVEELGESAFWSCESLRRADVQNPAARLAPNVFGACPALREGYVAPGYPLRADAPAELLYTLLWCSCPERHGAAVSARAEAFVRGNEALIMEHVLRGGNAPALAGLVRRGLLRGENIAGYLRQTLRDDQRELTALLLAAGEGHHTPEEELDL